MSKRFVSYFRVSTKRQGESGLGLEAQREAVRKFVGDGQVVASFEEVESGGRSDRPALDAALRACRLRNATLVIAKLDRLARSVAFVSRLMEEGVDFVAVDNPNANRLTVHLLAAIAEHERELISQRTKAALQAAKARGVKLGNPRGADTMREHGEMARTRSMQVRMERSASRASEVVSIIEDVQAAGPLSLRGLAAELNNRTIPAPRGGEWTAVQVRRVLARREAA
jgi:DNA invertase Pin-like site-specific DNA recombinase